MTEDQLQRIYDSPFHYRLRFGGTFDEAEFALLVEALEQLAVEQIARGKTLPKAVAQGLYWNLFILHAWSYSDLKATGIDKKLLRMLDAQLLIERLVLRCMGLPEIRYPDRSLAHRWLSYPVEEAKVPVAEEVAVEAFRKQILGNLFLNRLWCNGVYDPDEYQQLCASWRNLERLWAGRCEVDRVLVQGLMVHELVLRELVEFYDARMRGQKMSEEVALAWAELQGLMLNCLGDEGGIDPERIAWMRNSGM